MTDATVEDLRRELAKARETLAATETHLARYAEANAALHCAVTVMYSPLHARVVAAVAGIDHALERTRGADVEWPVLIVKQEEAGEALWRRLFDAIDRAEDPGDATNAVMDVIGPILPADIADPPGQR